MARHLWETRAAQVSVSCRRCSKIASSILFRRVLLGLVATAAAARSGSDDNDDASGSGMVGDGDDKAKTWTAKEL